MLMNTLGEPGLCQPSLLTNHPNLGSKRCIKMLLRIVLTIFCIRQFVD